MMNQFHLISALKTLAQGQGTGKEIVGRETAKRKARREGSQSTEQSERVTRLWHASPNVGLAAIDQYQ